MIKINQHTKNKLHSFITNHAICWYLKLANGTELRFINYDKNIKIKNKIFYAYSIFSYKLIEKNCDPNKENNEIYGIIDNKYFNQKDIIDGKLSNAYIEIFLVNLADLDNFTPSIHQGYINNINILNNKFIAKISPKYDKFNKKITKSFSKQCRAQFCDEQCKLDKNNHTFYGTITRIISNSSFYDTNRNEENFYFNCGEVKFTSGYNKDKCFEVKNFKDNEIELKLPITCKLKINDKYIITAGCDKNFTTCSHKFQNTINFRGEPYISNVLSSL